MHRRTGTVQDREINPSSGSLASAEDAARVEL